MRCDNKIKNFGVDSFLICPATTKRRRGGRQNNATMTTTTTVSSLLFPFFDQFVRSGSCSLSPRDPPDGHDKESSKCTLRLEEQDTEEHYYEAALGETSPPPPTTLFLGTTKASARSR